MKPGVEIITPDPGFSGSSGVTAFLENTIALSPPPGAKRRTRLSEGNGDALISYEIEAILARQNHEPFGYVIPDDTLQRVCRHASDLGDRWGSARRRAIVVNRRARVSGDRHLWGGED